MSRFTRFIRESRQFPYWYGARFGSETGVERGQGKVPLIVSLTTIPERLEKMSIATESLLRQSLKPDRLVLWLDDGLKNRKLPTPLNRQTGRGLEIRFVEDVGPQTKVFYALKEFPNCLVVTCDDDVIYPRDWLKELAEAHERQPQAITCHRAHRMLMDQAGKLLPYRRWDWLSPGHAGPSPWLFPLGIGGVLYPPNALPPEVFNRDVFRKICPWADDVWLKAMSLLNHVGCQKVRPHSKDWPAVRGTQHKTLSAGNVENGQNDVQLEAVFNHYDLVSRLKMADFPLLSPRQVV